MSNINIRRAIENIRTNTTVYTPVVELIVNAIQAIDESGRTDGRVSVRALRSGQVDLDGSLPEIIGFEIEDNGIGFSDEHRNSFDTLYTDRKISEGGKGFGRFTCLKYFEDVHFSSVYREGSNCKNRKFSMGRDYDIIVGEELTLSKAQNTGTVASLAGLRRGPVFEKKLVTIARNLAERLLPFFITEGYVCPDIVLSEHDGSSKISLNKFVQNEGSRFIRELHVDQNNFNLTASDDEEDFLVRIFKIYAPRNQKSRISLVAHKREVSGSSLHKYIPEFEDEFYETAEDSGSSADRNYIIKAYVFGDYLDRNVSLERGGFEFAMENDVILGIAQIDIETKAATIAGDAVASDITSRRNKKLERIQTYVDKEAPWHKSVLSKIDLSQMPYKPTDEQIEICLHQKKFSEEIETRKNVEKLLSETNFQDVKNSVVKIVNKISGTSKNDLIHYIALRRTILDIFKRSLQIDQSGSYSSEGVVHDVIFPRRSDTEITSFEDHNLWIIDERLNFTDYVSSDVPLDGPNTERPDLLVYNKRVLFRGDNEASNPIMIFEFKKPQRDDFVNPSSNEDPVQQVVRYVNDIQDGKYKTPKGRNIRVDVNTLFYGVVVCDLTQKVERWLDREKNFKPMPDRLGWFLWMENINLYIEVISWDKVSRDAEMRNKKFFKTLGI